MITQLPPRLQVKHRPRPKVPKIDEDIDDNPVGPTYSPTHTPPSHSPKIFAPNKPSKETGSISLGAVLLIITAVALIVFYIYTIIPTTHSRPIVIIASPPPKPRKPKTISTIIGPSTKLVEQQKLYTYEQEKQQQQQQQQPYDPNQRRQQSEIYERYRDPVEYWLTGLFNEKILDSQSTCRVPLPSRDDLIIEKEGVLVEFDPRIAKEVEQKCITTNNRLWMNEEQGFSLGRCITSPTYKSGVDKHPIRSKLFKEKRILLKEEDKAKIPLNTSHEVFQFECTELGKTDRDVRVRIAKNMTLYEAALRYHHEKEHPLNIMHIVIEGASRANFHRQMRLLSRKLESIEHGYTNHRVFQFFRHQSIKNMITKSKKKVTLGHSASIWDMAKSRGHITMYATTRCPYVRINKKHFKQMTGYEHTTHVDHNLASLFCKTKDDKCLAGKDRSYYISEYAKDFMKKYGGIGRTFLLHFYDDEMNAILDAYLATLVEQITNEHPHTVVILSAGGRARMDGEYYYSSALGNVESKLPLLIMVVPQMLEKKYPDVWDNLYHNQQVVTAPRDLIRTMEVILEYPKVLQNKRSLFTTKFDAKRTCKEAGISNRWCICDHKMYGTTIFDPTITAEEAAVSLNKRMSKYSICESPIEFDSVVVTGSSDDVIAWRTTSGIVYETDKRTKKTRLVSEKQQDYIKVRNGELAICDKRKIPLKDRNLCVCKQLKEL
jgi:hypothetical protein